MKISDLVVELLKLPLDAEIKFTKSETNKPFTDDFRFFYKSQESKGWIDCNIIRKNNNEQRSSRTGPN